MGMRDETNQESLVASLSSAPPPYLGRAFPKIPSHPKAIQLKETPPPQSSYLGQSSHCERSLSSAIEAGGRGRGGSLGHQGGQLGGLEDGLASRASLLSPRAAGPVLGGCWRGGAAWSGDPGTPPSSLLLPPAAFPFPH